MMRLVVSTCGTSLLTHQPPEDLRELLNRYANAQRDQIPGEALAELDTYIESQRRRLLAAGVEEARHLSAELNGILALLDGEITEAARRDHHILVASDTYLGRRCAGTVVEWLRRRQIRVQEPEVIPNLVTDELKTFHNGVQHLVLWCENVLPGYHQQRYRIVFNLTGGFKAFQGVMTTLAHEYADEVVYIFQGSKELLRIPALPFKWDPISICREHFAVLRKLMIADRPAGEVGFLPELLVVDKDGLVSLSLLGQLVWAKGQRVLYGERLHEPPSHLIRYRDRFRNDVKAISDPKRIRQINERVDDLERHLRGLQLASREASRIRPVQGKPTSVPREVSHECYAWSDGAACRIFFHYDQGGIVLDALGPHL